MQSRFGVRNDNGGRPPSLLPSMFFSIRTHIRIKTTEEEDSQFYYENIKGGGGKVREFVLFGKENVQKKSTKRYKKDKKEEHKTFVRNSCLRTLVKKQDWRSQSGARCRYGVDA